MTKPSELLNTLGINTTDGKIVYTTEEFWLLKDAVVAFEELLENFENQPTKHMLRLIAKDMQGNGTNKEIKRARGNWLIHFVKAIESD